MTAKVLPKFGILVALLISFAVTGPVAGQEQEGSKGIKAEIFIKNRPPDPTPRRIPKKSTYKSAQVNSLVAPPAGKVFAQVGVTIWRFRPATSADKTKELVEEEDVQPSQWSLERVADGTLLAPGQKVRLAIESLTHDGYLYVIDREQYADGSFGEARLIFPTKRTPEGGNSVKAGKLIYIPGAPKYFRIKPSQTSKGHVAEVLTVLVSPKPLIDAALLAPTAIVIERDQLAMWEKQWQASPTKFEMEGGVGLAMSESEQAAGLNNSELTKGQPVPQTIYRLAIKPEDTLLVTVPLRFVMPKP